MKRVTMLSAAGFLLAGCGLTVPDIHEFTEDKDAGKQFVHAVISNIACEVQDSLYDLRRDFPNGTFIDNWGIELTLSLTMDEKGSLNPTVNWAPSSPASALFNISGGATLSSDATRINKVNFYYLVSDLQNAKCSDQSRPRGPFLLQSDLKLRDWLYSMVIADETKLVEFKRNTIAGPFKDSVLSHEVKFEIHSSGSVTPTWTLTRVSVNPGGPFLSASRNRTHDLVITIGPADATYQTKVVNGKKTTTVVAAQPSPRAAGLHQASDIGNAVAAAIRSASPR